MDESYNANPASMRATLKALGQTPALRRIAVLGTMGELGDFAARFHRQLAEPLAEAKIDHAILVGDGMRELAAQLGKGSPDSLGFAPSFTHCDDTDQAIIELENFGVTNGDVVLVKGSNFMGLGRLVSHFSSASG